MQKIIKFHLQEDFNMKNTFNIWISYLNSKMWDLNVKRVNLYFIKHLSLYAKVFYKVRIGLYFTFKSRIIKFKRPIQIIQCNPYLKILLDTKFYIKKNCCVFLWMKNHYYWIVQKLLNQCIFRTFTKIVNKFKK